MTALAPVATRRSRTVPAGSDGLHHCRLDGWPLLVCGTDVAVTRSDDVRASQICLPVVTVLPPVTSGEPATCEAGRDDLSTLIVVGALSVVTVDGHDSDHAPVDAVEWGLCASSPRSLLDRSVRHRRLPPGGRGASFRAAAARQ